MGSQWNSLEIVATPRRSTLASTRLERFEFAGVRRVWSQSTRSCSINRIGSPISSTTSNSHVAIDLPPRPLSSFLRVCPVFISARLLNTYLISRPRSVQFPPVDFLLRSFPAFYRPRTFTTSRRGRLLLLENRGPTFGQYSRHIAPAPSRHRCFPHIFRTKRTFRGISHCWNRADSVSEWQDK